MTSKPILSKQFKQFKNSEDFVKDGIVSANFTQAYTYNGKAFETLVYMTLVHNIFFMEYTICKLNSGGKDILNMENQVLNGQMFWRDPSIRSDSDYGIDTDENEQEVSKDNSDMIISAKIIKRIVEERRQRSLLADDLSIVRNNMEKFMIELFPNKEDITIRKVTNSLINYHHLIYYFFVPGLERIQENLCNSVVISKR